MPCTLCGNELTTFDDEEFCAGCFERIRNKEKEELAAELNRLAENNDFPEETHLEADNLLLNYIDDKDVTEAFYRIRKWYA